MKAKYYILTATLASLMALPLASCNNNNVPVQVEKHVLGSVLVNDKPYEHALYFSNYGTQVNPFLQSNKKHSLIYLPIFLTPLKDKDKDKGKEGTVVEYVIQLFMDSKDGVPVLNKPYNIARSTIIENLTNNNEVYRLFISDRVSLMGKEAQGIAVLHNYKNRRRLSAKGTIVFTSYDKEKKTCTGTYSLATEVPKDGVLVFKNGNFATRITSDPQSV